MGLSCVEGLTSSGFLAHVWAMKEHKQRPGGRSVRRRLFGNVGADAARISLNNIRSARQQLKSIVKADSERWNFDFTNMKPKEGPLVWRPVDENTTPVISPSASPCHDNPAASPCHPAASSRLSTTSPCGSPPTSPSRSVLGTRENDINNSANISTTHSSSSSNFATATTSIASTSKTSPATTTTIITPATTTTITSPTKSTTSTTNTKTTTSPTKTKRDSKHQLKRLIRKDSSNNNNNTNNTRRGFRQTLCTDYFKTVRTARA